MSENRPPSNMSTDSKTTFKFSKLKNQTKNDPLKSKNRKKLQITKCQKTDPPQICPLIPNPKWPKIKSDPKYKVTQNQKWLKIKSDLKSKVTQKQKWPKIQSDPKSKFTQNQTF